MPFSESLKSTVRERANFQCCICEEKSVSLEVHHIIPETKGGPNTEDNAAPLCPTCHSNYGANDEKRKRIQEMRDHWYKKCDEQREINAKLEEINSAVHQNREDIERIAVRNKSYILGSSEDGMQSSFEHSRYSFAREVLDL